MKMKKRMLAVSLSILMFLSFLSGCGNTTTQLEAVDPGEGLEKFSGTAYKGDNADLEGMMVAAENSAGTLLIDTATTDIAYIDKKSGKVYQSNPLRNAPEEIQASTEYKNKNCSLLTVKYFSVKGEQYEYNTGKDSVPYDGQVQIYKIDNGIRIVFVLGKDESSRLLPPVLSVETYDRIVEQANANDKLSMKDSYLLVNSDDKDSKNYKTFIEDYPGLADNDLYVLRSLTGQQKKYLEEAMRNANFTLEEMAAEMEAAGYAGETDSVLFTIPLDITVNDRGMRAEVDASLISSVSKQYLNTISVLKGFGSSYDGKGYMFIPDGSGSIVERQGNALSEDFTTKIYGSDLSITTFKDVGSSTLPAVMPVFGMGDDTSAMVGMIESGASMSAVTVRQSTDTNPLSNVNAEFTYYEKDFRDYSGKMRVATGILFPKRPAQCVYGVQYAFLNGEDMGYSDIANYYRNQLIEQDVLKKLEDSDYPLTIELLGNIKKKDTVVGIPVEVNQSLTTYDQAQEILKAFIDKGITDINFAYAGIFNGGMNHTAMNKVSLMGNLGGKSAYGDLLGFISDNDIRYYPQLDLLYAYEDKLGDGFSSKKDSAKRLDMTVSEFGDVDPATREFGGNNWRYIVMPSLLPGYADKALSALEKYGAYNGVSFGALGSNVNTNYRRNNLQNRYESEAFYQEVMQKAVDSGKNVMVNQGNAYTWAYADDILDLVAGTSGHVIEKQAVPFVQMVLHGYVRYTTSPLNISSDIKNDVLRILETGSGIHLKMMYEKNTVLKETSYEDLYSLYYGDWVDLMSNYYDDISSVLAQVANVDMVSHKQLEKNVFETTYANGVSVIVNYNDTAVTINGTKIDAVGYHVSGGRAK